MRVCCLPQTPERFVINGVALDTDRTAAGSGVTFCFTERIGGVSHEPYASLNLGRKGGDDAVCVEENRHRVLDALGASYCADALVIPQQVHGDTVAVISDAGAPLPPEIESGADAVVCTMRNRPVMLLFADCVPVVLVAPGAFAVAHSGWRGTLAGIAGKTARVLAETARCGVDQVSAYIGPHISADAYEVSDELLGRFVDRFGPCARGPKERHLCLDTCVRASLAEAGVLPEQVVSTGLCTASLTDRFFSHRAEHGITGRHAAVAFMPAADGNTEVNEA